MSTPALTPPSTGSIRIAPLTEIAQFQRCVDLQVAIWSYSEGDLIPRRMFLLAQRIGGQVLGAVNGDGEDDTLGHPDSIIGFAMALPGFRNGRPYLHSHMLAVLPEFRNAGLGRRLKLAQRDDALARGFDLMEWTFDPLEMKNAYLNLSRLGAIARRYHPDFYGPSSSPLQGGLPTDRLYAEWWLRSPRVLKTLRGDHPSVTTLERTIVPHAISQWKADPERRTEARALQNTLRETLQSAFARNLAAVGFERTAHGDGSYLLGAAEDLELT